MRPTINRNSGNSRINLMSLQNIMKSHTLYNCIFLVFPNFVSHLFPRSLTTSCRSASPSLQSRRSPSLFSLGREVRSSTEAIVSSQDPLIISCSGSYKNGIDSNLCTTVANIISPTLPHCASDTSLLMRSSVIRGPASMWRTLRLSALSRMTAPLSSE